jgi:plasmid stabilization system protein ParE
MTRYRLNARARAEIRKAEEHYRGEGDRISHAFAKAVRGAIDLITTLPESSPADDYGIRRKHLTSFPFTLIYYLEDDVVEIVALMHQSQKPGYWRDRL